MSVGGILASLQPKDAIAILLSGASFVLSGYALWVAQFNRGRVKMTQPTLIVLMRDMPASDPKIFLRTLLFTTGTKGRVVQSMFLKVHQRGGTYLFDFWGHTEGGKLTLGGGLFVGPTGIACDHHFNPRGRSGDFLYVDGDYRIEIFAVVVGRRRPSKLMEVAFTVDRQKAAELIQTMESQLRLFWDPDAHTYDQYIDYIDRPPRLSVTPKERADTLPHRPSFP